MWKFCGKAQFLHNFGWIARKYAICEVPWNWIAFSQNSLVIIPGLLCHLIRCDTGRLTTEAFLSNPIVSSKQKLRGLKILTVCRNCAFPQNFRTRKLAEIAVFFAVCTSNNIFGRVIWDKISKITRVIYPKSCANQTCDYWLITPN